MSGKLDLATIVGVTAGLGLIVMAIFMGGGAGVFFNVPSLLIVVGGTIAATLINFPLREVMRVIKVTPRAFTSSYSEPVKIMEQLVHLCGEAKKGGVLGLESQAKQINNKFFQSAVGMVVDGLEPDQVTSTLRLQNMSIQERHKTGRKVFESMGMWAPAFGMIGTLIGLVQMLANMADPQSIGPKMAVALLTTFYGAVMANVLFLPMAGKLKRLTEIEVVTNQIITEGIVGIQKGAAPTILEGKLKSFLETARQEEKLAKKPAAQPAGAA
jgi:chemotaxis protein MotA